MKQTRFLSIYSRFLAVCTWLLIVAGGLVTSHKAGLAVPDWPTSYGQMFPPMVGNIFWEHGHRMIAGTVGILTLIFGIIVQRFETRKWMKILGWTAVGAVFAQALLGGLTVIYLLPDPISISHACLAQTFFSLVVAMAYFLHPVSQSSPEPELFRMKRLAYMTTGFIYLQLILGATLRHTGHALPLHVLGALLVFIHVLLTLLRVTRFYSADVFLSRCALGLGLLTTIQIFLGIGAMIFVVVLHQGDDPSLGSVLFTAAHQSTGALILASSVLISLRVSK